MNSEGIEKIKEVLAETNPVPLPEDAIDDKRADINEVRDMLNDLKKVNAREELPRRQFVKVLMFDGPYDGHTYEADYVQLSHSRFRYNFLVPPEPRSYERMSFAYFDGKPSFQNDRLRVAVYEFSPLYNRRHEIMAFAAVYMGMQ